MKIEPGSLILDPDEVARLRELSDVWSPTTERSLVKSLLELARAVRELLAEADADLRKPVVR